MVKVLSCGGRLLILMGTTMRIWIGRWGRASILTAGVLWLFLGGSVRGEMQSEQNLIGHWKLNDAAGDNLVEDALGHHHGAFFSGDFYSGNFSEAATADHSTTGRVGNGLEFDQGFIFIPDPSFFNFERNTPFTVSMWVRGLPGNGLMALFGKYDASASCEVKGYYAFVNQANGRLTFSLQALNQCFNNPVEVSARVEGRTNILDGDWHHLVFQNSAESGVGGYASDLRIFIDGQEETVDVRSNNLGGNAYHSIRSQSTGVTGLKFGSRGDQWVASFTGAIDEIRVYNAAIETDLIFALYADGLGTEEPVNDPWILTPLLETPELVAIASDAVMLDCRMPSVGALGLPVTEVGVEYGLVGGFDEWVSIERSYYGDDNQFQIAITGLEPGAGYQFRSYARNAFGVGVSGDVLTSTLPEPAESVGASTLLSYTPAVVENPLKGFVPAQGLTSEERGSFPHSMTRAYVPLRAVMTGPATFDWTYIEDLLATAAAEGNQMVLRVYLDYPSNPNIDYPDSSVTGIPQFLLDGGLTTYFYTQFGNSTQVTPNYEDPNLRAALQAFIAAFGAQYDGDPRLGFVELGLLGHWGEWHTYPQNNRMASARTQQEVLDAYLAAFQETHLLNRYPSPIVANLPLGLHDDYFAVQTMPTTISPWFFLGAMEYWGGGMDNKWQSLPIGGELASDGFIGDCIFEEPSCVDPAQGFDVSYAASHTSWLWYGSPFGSWYAPGFTGEERARALEGAGKLGYEFHIRSFSYLTGDDHLRVDLEITNTGVAPFYYRWPVELAAVSPTGDILKIWETPWDITTPLPETTPTRYGMMLDDRPVDSFTLVVRGRNPMAGGKPIKFANVTQDQTLEGWMTLGEIPALSTTPTFAQALYSAPTVTALPGGGGLQMSWVENTEFIDANGLVVVPQLSEDLVRWYTDPGDGSLFALLLDEELDGRRTVEVATYLHSGKCFVRLALIPQ